MKSYEFWNKVKQLQRQGQRRGQAVFNIAYEMNEKQCVNICEKIGDPFNDESKVIDFVSELKFED